MNYKGIRRYFFIVIIMIIVVEFVIFCIDYNYKKADTFKHTEIAGKKIASVIQTELAKCANTADLLEDLYNVYGDAFLNNYEITAAELVKNEIAIGSLYFAPAGIVEYAYPKKVLDTTLHFEPAKDKEQGPKARLAKDTRMTTIAGPHTLVQGGEGFIIRNPIYNGDEFVAFTIVVFDKTVFFNRVTEKLTEEVKKYNFAIWKDYDPTALVDDDGYIIRSTQEEIEKKVVYDFETVNDVWHVVVEPVTGFSPLADMKSNFASYMTSAVVLFLITILCFRKVAQARFEKSQIVAKEEKAFNAVHEAIRSGQWGVYFNEKDEIIDCHWSDTFRHMLGYNDENDFPNVLESWSDCLYPEDKLRSLNEFWETVRDHTGKKIYDNQKRMVLKNGECRWFRSAGRIVRRADGSAEAFYGVFIDIHELVTSRERLQESYEEQLRQDEELKKALEKADNANMAKSTFLFNMSHDIRTPMNAILGYVELLKNKGDNKEVRDDYIEKINMSGHFMLDLINNVLDMSRIESGEATLQEELFDTGEVVESLYTVFDKKIKDKNIKYTVHDSIVHRYIYFDKVKIEQIFMNILGNAIKYTPDGGSIDLLVSDEVTDEDGVVLIKSVVKDTGVGMSEEFLPHIFEQFTREKTVTESRIAGTGLGLGIVKKLVELMNGTINVESAVGVGTTVTVIIPHRIGEEIRPSESVEVKAKNGSISGKRILLAEDNEINVEIAKDILNEFGVTVEVASDGMICIEMLSNHEAGYYDLILMDVQMPNMDGVNATQEIRKLSDEGHSSITIVAMTANAFEEDQKRCLDAGMNDFLAKPIEIPKLVETLTKYLG